MHEWELMKRKRLRKLEIKKRSVEWKIKNEILSPYHDQMHFKNLLKCVEREIEQVKEL